MLNLMVVAGEQSQNLAEHLNKNAAFKVNYSFDTLSNNYLTIKKSIIQVDKLLYVYRPELMDIRKDMSMLQELLTEDSFFTTSEIIFLQKSSDQNGNAADYFLAVMKECNRVNKQSKNFKEEIHYTIQTIEGALTFQNINDFLLGITQMSNERNTFVNFYRKEKGDEDKTAYTKKNTSKHKIEPFNFSNLENYAVEKKAAVKTDNGSIVKTNDSDKVDILSNPIFGELGLTNSIVNIPSFIISGNGKSGKATFTTALAVSSSQLMKKTLILDCTAVKKIYSRINSEGITVSKIESSDLLGKDYCATSPISVCNLTDKKEILRYYLQLFYTKDLAKIGVDQIFVVIDPEDLLTTYQIIKPFIVKVFFSSLMYTADLKRVAEELNSIAEFCEVYVLLNTYLNVTSSTTYSTKEDVKEVFSPFVKLVAPIYLQNFNIDSSLYLKLLEVKNHGFTDNRV